MKRIRYKEGDLFSIELEDGRKAICKIILAPKESHKQAIGCTLIGFQEDINLEKLDLDAHLQLFSNPIAHTNPKSKDIFFTGNQNLKNGIWEIIGFHPINESEKDLQWYESAGHLYHQDEYIRLLALEEINNYPRLSVMGFDLVKQVLKVVYDSPTSQG